MQLGQFHDALAELLEWIATCKNRLTNAGPPAVKVRKVEAQTHDLEVSECGTCIMFMCRVSCTTKIPQLTSMVALIGQSGLH